MIIGLDVGLDADLVQQALVVSAHCRIAIVTCSLEKDEFLNENIRVTNYETEILNW